MTEPAKSTNTSPAQEARAERLAAALRENLKRRKARERARQQADGPGRKPVTGKD